MFLDSDLPYSPLNAFPDTKNKSDCPQPCLFHLYLIHEFYFIFILFIFMSTLCFISSLF